MSRDDGTADAMEIVVTNEFATVVVRKILTRNGERLEIASPTSGRAVRLDALVLESLTWGDALALGEGLTTPFGPTADEPAPTPPHEEP